MTTITSPPAGLPAAPWLSPLLRRVWRAPGTLQIGIDPARAVMLRGATQQVARLVSMLDGRRTLPELVEQSGLERESCYEILGSLTRAGLLVDLADGPDHRPEPAQHPALAGPLVAEVHGRALGSLQRSPVATMRSRADALVVLVGGGRLGAALAGILAGSGIGRLGVVQPGIVTGAEPVPGGASVQDVGRDRLAALSAAVARANPRTIVSAPGASDRPDVVVLAEPVDPTGERVRMLMRTRTPFLSATIRERRGVVGPFVSPGESSCLECQELARREIDRGWSAVQCQLVAAPPSVAEGGETALVTMTAALAATQVLQWVDGERLPETVNTTLEIALPDLVLERRYWPRRRDCACLIG